MSHAEAKSSVYVPRTPELNQLERWVENEPGTSAGRAALLVGRSGMGKTVLLDQFADLCRRHPGGRWYTQIIPFSPETESIPPWERLLVDAQSLTDSAPTMHSSEDRKLLGELLSAVPVLGKVMKHLAGIDRRPAWERFIEYLTHLSGHLLAKTGRLILIIDPQAAMQNAKTGDWVTVAQALPPAIRLIIAQRPDDALSADADCRRRFRVVPESGSLGEFTTEQVDQFYESELKWGRLRELSKMWTEEVGTELPSKAYARYRGYPLAHGAVARVLVDQAPADPIAAIQSWPAEVEALLEMLFASLKKQSVDRYRAMLTLHIFGCPVPAEPWAQSAGISVASLMAALADARFEQLLVITTTDSRRMFAPFHPLFAERIERELADLPDLVEQAAGAIWDTIRPALDPEQIQKSGPPEFELRASGGVIARLRDFGHLVGVVNQICGVKLRLGWLDEIESDLDQVLVKPECSQPAAAACYCNLGLVYLTRGDVDQAEAMLDKAHAINEKLGRLEGMANTYGNLGNVYQTRGDLEQAEAMYRKALEIKEKLGLLEGMASAYGNLGNVYQTRGDLVQAEDMHRKSLAIFEQLGRLEGMASTYCSLGIVNLTRGDLDHAEAMIRKALAINEQLGWLEGMAIDFSSLGMVYKIRGDLKQTRNLWMKARDLFAKIGKKDKVELIQGALDELDAENGPKANADD